MSKHLQHCILILLSLSLIGCIGLPKGIKTVDNVDPAQYLGTWYEIARLDHSFERGLERVTATYQTRDDGGIEVINRGYDPKEKRWNKAVGKAYFIDAPNKDGLQTGRLKVSFFGPFYGAYNIIALDKPYYNYVMICGPNFEYLWIMSRTPQLTYPIKQELISQAKALGFDTAKLIHVKQSHEIIEYDAGPHMNE